MKKTVLGLVLLSLSSQAFAQFEAGDTAYSASYFMGMEGSGEQKSCKDLEVEVKIEKNIPKWVRNQALKDLSVYLKPADIQEYPPEAELFKVCEGWLTTKRSLMAEVLYHVPGERMSIVFYLDEKNCCDSKKTMKRAYTYNVNLADNSFYDLATYYQKHKRAIDAEVMSKVRRRYSENWSRKYINMISLEDKAPVGFDDRGFLVFSVSTIKDKEHVPWIVAYDRLPAALPWK